MEHSIMTEKLARRGIAVPNAYHADPLRTTFVRAVMTTSVATVPIDASFDAALTTMRRTGHGAFPLVDGEGRLVGIVSRADLLEVDGDRPAGVKELASTEVVTVSPDDTLHLTLMRMLEEGVDHIPVLDDGRLVGICTRADVFTARARQLEQEHPEPGWLPIRRSSRTA